MISFLDSFSGSILVCESWTITPSTQAQKKRSEWQTLRTKKKKKSFLQGTTVARKEVIWYTQGGRNILKGSSSVRGHVISGFLSKLIKEELLHGVFTVGHGPRL